MICLTTVQSHRHQQPFPWNDSLARAYTLPGMVYRALHNTYTLRTLSAKTISAAFDDSETPKGTIIDSFSRMNGVGTLRLLRQTLSAGPIHRTQVYHSVPVPHPYGTWGDRGFVFHLTQIASDRLSIGSDVGRVGRYKQYRSVHTVHPISFYAEKEWDMNDSSCVPRWEMGRGEGG